MEILYIYNGVFLDTRVIFNKIYQQKLVFYHIINFLLHLAL